MREAASFIARQHGPAPAGVLPVLFSALRAFISRWQRRRQITRLTDIDDHLLCDIGVTREDVRWALDLPFSHDPGVELQRRALRNRQAGWCG